MTKRPKAAKGSPWPVLAIVVSVLVISAGVSRWAYNNRAPEVMTICPPGAACFGSPAMVGQITNTTTVPSVGSIYPADGATAVQIPAPKPAPAPICPPPPKQIHHPISHRAPSIVRSPVLYLHNPQVWE